MENSIPITADELSATLGANVHRARTRLQLTRQEVASYAWMSVEFYSRIERGNALPSVRKFSRLVEVLQVSVDELLGFVDAEASAPSWQTFHLSDDSPEVLQIIRRVRMGTPKTLGLMSLLVKEMNQIDPEGGDASDQGADDSPPDGASDGSPGTSSDPG